MKEELKDLTRKLNEAQFVVNKLLRQQTETQEELFTFTKDELLTVIDDFYAETIRHFTQRDVSSDIVDLSFSVLDYDNSVNIEEAYLSDDAFDYDTEEYVSGLHAELVNQRNIAIIFDTKEINDERDNKEFEKIIFDTKVEDAPNILNTTQEG